MGFFHSKEELLRRRSEKRSYSQCGEDLIVSYVFSLRGASNPSYIDVGAHHPYQLSNSAYFYDRGCRGINIEANPKLIQEFNWIRPEDINLNVGIGAQNGEMDFYVMEDSTLSTFSKSEVTVMCNSNKKVAQILKINIVRLDDILEKYFDAKFPDFLSLDVEGMDFEILQSIAFERHSPKVICVEAAEYSPVGAGKRRGELIDFLVSKGYYEYANTNLNAIMVRNDFWFI
jgi:FkbM family methyltransferase